jgi:RimJ/RimL family protein N-acetyltransferase
VQKTARLELIPQTPQLLRALMESVAAYEEQSGFKTASGLRDFFVSGEVSAEFLEQLAKASIADPWVHGFAVVHAATREVIGTVGFKGAPDPDGVVEIGCGIVPDYRDQGFATEAARALTELAFGEASVKVVRAHTLPEPNASTRVLAKAGFLKEGEVIDPHDGKVWRWERTR